MGANYTSVCLFLLLPGNCGVLEAEGHGKGQCCVAVWYLTLYFGYFILPPRWLVGVTPCPNKSQKNYTKEKTATDKRQRRFFYTFFYLLGSTTIPWVKEFFSWIPWNGWIPQLRCQKYVNRFMHVFVLIWYFGLP